MSMLFYLNGNTANIEYVKDDLSDQAGTVFKDASGTLDGLISGFAIRTIKPFDEEPRTLLFVSTSDGDPNSGIHPGSLLKYDPTAKVFTVIGVSVDNTPLPGLAVDAKGILWASGNSGVYMYDQSSAAPARRVAGGWESIAQLQYFGGYLFHANWVSQTIEWASTKSLLNGAPDTASITSSKLSVVVEDSTDYTGDMRDTLPPRLIPLGLHACGNEDDFRGGKLYLALSLHVPTKVAGHSTALPRVASVRIGDLMDGIIPPYPPVPASLHYPANGINFNSNPVWGVTRVSSNVVMCNDANGVFISDMQKVTSVLPRFVQYADGLPDA
jgi:hypothetical protein